MFLCLLIAAPFILVVLIPCLLYNLRAHETVLDLVCRLLLEKKKKTNTNKILTSPYNSTILYSFMLALLHSHYN